eukprot:6212756-Pleurochrysis_carterae.AAC.2
MSLRRMIFNRGPCTSSPSNEAIDALLGTISPGMSIGSCIREAGQPGCFDSSQQNIHAPAEAFQM